MTSRRAAIIGAGWSGAVLARELHDAGWRVVVFEANANVGGHARMEKLNGVMYEPNGAHIFHTSNDIVASFVGRFGLSRPFEHRVKTVIYPVDNGDPWLMSWPPQVGELKALPQWPVISKELDDLPSAPAGEDFEAYVITLMGRTLYGLFIKEYTEKQWGRPANELSSRFAPRRVDLRRDGYTRLFRDKYEFFPATGYQSIVEEILRPISVVCGSSLSLKDVAHLKSDFDQIIITSPLDDFCGMPGQLEWRGIKMVSRYYPEAAERDTVTSAYVVNHPSSQVAYTRTVETKHASGQAIAGSVVSEEYPGASEKHYPVPTVDRRNELRNAELKDLISSESSLPVDFCGRLANYEYINMDEAILSARRLAGKMCRRS